MKHLTRLGLLLGLAAAGAPPVAAQEPAGTAIAVTPELIAKGDTIFHKSGLCYACHGNNAQGSLAPNLTDGEWIHGDGSLEMIAQTIITGVPQEKAKSGIMMPPKGGSAITEDEVKAVAAYVHSLNQKAPGS